LVLEVLDLQNRIESKGQSKIDTWQSAIGNL